VTKAILITGAAGFIGSHTAQALLARGDTVIGLDNLNDYYDPARKQANLRELSRSSDAARFSFVAGDIRDRELVARLFGEHDVAAVIHLAAMAGVRVSIENPYLYYDVNVNGTLTLLEGARKAHTGNFVLASSSSVYGTTTVVPFVESDAADRPLAPYAASKRAAEMLGFTYHHLYGQHVTVLRFFTVYGPRGRPDMMPYKVLDNMFYGREVPLYNNGQMYRDWTYIDDIVAGIIAAADRPLGYQIINLGRGEPVLLADFVQHLARLAGRQVNLSPAPMPAADVAYTYADISKARALLGYAPGVSVEEGIARLWRWYQVAVLGQA